MSSQSRDSVLTVRIHRSQEALARGALTGVRITWTLSVANTSSKDAELGVAVMDEKPKRPVSFVEGQREVPRLLIYPGPVGVSRAAGEVDAPSGELDEYQHVDPLEPLGLNGEEVTRNHARSLLCQELSPRRGAAAGRRPEAATNEQISDRRSRHLDPELLQFALDAPVAPSRILRCQAEDQLPQLCRQRRPAWTSVVAAQLRADQLPVPALQSLWGYEETLPTSPWQWSSSSFRHRQGLPGLFLPHRRARPVTN
jgi:hypothetical protein